MNWNERKSKIEKLMNVKIIKTSSGINPSYSYRPGGKSIGYESIESVMVDLETKYMMANLIKL